MCSLYLIPDDEEAAERTLSWFNQEDWSPKETTVEEFMQTKAVLWLASDDSSFVNRHALLVDGLLSKSIIEQDTGRFEE